MALYLSNTDERDDEHADIWPHENDGLVFIWCTWSVLVIVALAVAYLGYPRIAGTVLLATSVVIGVLFKRCEWWWL